MTSSKRPRVFFKLSGQSLGDYTLLPQIVDPIIRVSQMGIAIVVGTGGGNIVRGNDVIGLVGRVRAHEAGMAATLVNGILLTGALTEAGAKARLHSTVEVTKFAEPYLAHRAESQLDKGDILVIACGMGVPNFTTDTAAVELAIELNAVVVKGTHSHDGVFTDDPATNPEAEHIPDISYDDLLERRLRVMDLTAITHARDNGLKSIRIFHQTGSESIYRALKDESVGSLIHA